MTLVSIDFIVACEIYRAASEKRRVWFTKLIELLDGVVSRNDISHSLDTLGDWGIVRGFYGETEKGRVSYNYVITDEAESRIKEIYVRALKGEFENYRPIEHPSGSE